jgi:hypothetical protein
VLLYNSGGETFFLFWRGGANFKKFVNISLFPREFGDVGGWGGEKLQNFPDKIDFFLDFFNITIGSR